MQKTLTKLPAWTLSALAVLVILWLTLAPDPVPDNDLTLFPGADKIIHALMFGGLTLCLIVDKARKPHWHQVKGIFILLATICSILLGVAIEFAQDFMAMGRAFEIYDIVADTVGAVLASALWEIFRHKKTSSRLKSENNQTEAPKPEAEPPQKQKRRVSKWVRIPLKVLLWLVIVILAVPVLLYIPPIQQFAVDTATSVISKSTGMKIEVGRFRLKFPLDIALDKVNVIEASGDTMVRARTLVADVKILPLIHGDIDVNKLRLLDGYYNMLSSDSSLSLKLNAGLLEAEPETTFDLKNMHLSLNKAKLERAKILLSIDVWKKKPTPNDTTSTPMVIKAKELDITDLTFGMTMLPTIDTLGLHADRLGIDNAIVDLDKNLIGANYVGIDKGSATFLTPDAEYVRAHPAPIDTTSQPSEPLTVKIDSISIDRFAAHYGTAGLLPAPGFDPSCIMVSDLSIGLKDFYNQSADISLPITRLKARERSGINILEGHGTVAVKDQSLFLDSLSLTTSDSHIYADADIPFSLFELNPQAAMNANISATIGQSDIRAFMPDLGKYLSALPNPAPISLRLNADGALENLDINNLSLNIPSALSLFAKGYLSNPLDIKRMQAQMEIDGNLSAPETIHKITGPTGINIPTLTIKGEATANRGTYSADINLLTSAGDLCADARTNINAETYHINASTRSLDIGTFLPEYGVGAVTALITAEGRGYNPTLPHASTDAEIHISSVQYKGKDYRDINLTAWLDQGEFDITVNSPNPAADLDLAASGSIDNGLYTIDATGHIRRLDIQELGLSDSVCDGNADFRISGSADPEKWLYDIDLGITDFDFNLPDAYYHLPAALTAKLKSTEDHVYLTLDSDKTTLDLNAQESLQALMEGFTKTAQTASLLIEEKRIDLTQLQETLPKLNLSVRASGDGLMSQLLALSGMSVDSLWVKLSTDSLITGNLGMLGINTGTMRIDTVGLKLNERRGMLDYRLNLGNRPGTMDEFASVTALGYIGDNRLSLSATQKNIKGETGYRIGLTAAMQDSLLSIHFIPLKATIAYLPWTLNADNYIDINTTGQLRIKANLIASSNQSSIHLLTQPSPEGDDELWVNLKNIHIQDFLSMSVFAPPVKASVNADMHLKYFGKGFGGKGSIDVNDLIYDRMAVGDFNLGMLAGMDFNGNTRAKLTLNVDNSPAVNLDAVLRNDSVSGKIKAEKVQLLLTKFPLRVANAFIGKKNASLQGFLNGDMSMNGTVEDPRFNGWIAFEDASAYIPMVGAKLRFDTVPVTVHENLVDFDQFDIFGANANPLTIDGTVDANKLSAVNLDLNVNARDFQLMNNDRRSKASLYGKLFLNLNASAKGYLSRLNVEANATVLSATNVTYVLATDPTVLTQNNTEGVVTFVQFSDSAKVNKTEEAPSAINMRLNANLTLQPGIQATVLLSDNGTDRVELQPSGSLNYIMNYMGDSSLNGQIYFGNGFARYSIPVIGEKMFVFEPDCYAAFSGDLLNPSFSIKAYDTLKATVRQDNSNTRLVNFKITLNASGTLNNPQVNFDITTDEDIAVQNELKSMSPDQRSQQAMNMLITGTYSGPGVKASANDTNMLYSFLESQINSWAAKNIRGVDLSFGIDQYNNRIDGEKQTSTSYSYQVSKSLFNNKFKIVVGGNYSTDASTDENFEQNLISDISFEYMLKQTQNISMLLRLFRHTGYESILEGEITETGAGFSMKRRISTLKDLFRFRRRKKKTDNTDTIPDSKSISETREHKTKTIQTDER